MNDIYPKGEVLAQNLVTILMRDSEITIISHDNPIHISLGSNDIYIFLKCISHGGKSYPENTTRAQLPERPIFSEIKKSSSIMMFWGYDIHNDVYVCWDPAKTKERLNKRKYVSFFSRKNEQEAVLNDEIRKASLSNGDPYVIFKSGNSAFFLKQFKEYFTDTENNGNTISIKEAPVVESTKNSETNGYLNAVELDQSVKLLIDEFFLMSPERSILKIISKCINTYGDYYPQMELKDWYNIVNKYIIQKDNSQDIYEIYDVAAEPNTDAD